MSKNEVLKMEEKYEAKRGYVEKIMRENAEIETLTEEQHYALEKLASIRHKIHTSWESMWNYESGDYLTLWAYIDCGINEMLVEADLPAIDFNHDSGDIPTNADYFDLTEEEQEEYGNDPWTWREESGAFDEFADFLADVNNKIENYLMEIDKKHGTHYAPTGSARLK